MSHKVCSVFRDGLFKGKSAIVTGGGTGIGRAITRELLYLGCNVMIASKNTAKLEDAAKEMKQENSPGQVEYTECNIRKEEQISDLMKTTLKRFGKIDFLVNNGGGQYPSVAEKITSKGWNAVIDTNLTGTFTCCREAYTQWMGEHGGAIVSILADMWKGFPGMSHTGAARAGVDNITKSLAIEWAPSGVRINAVAPGNSIYSPTALAHYDTPDRSDENNYSNVFTDVFNRQRPRIPAKRVGAPEEISAAVCFLLSPAAAFISGETVKVDGAHSLYSTSGVWEIPEHDRLPAYTWDKDARHKMSATPAGTNDNKQ